MQDDTRSLPLLLNGTWVNRKDPWTLQILFDGVWVVLDDTWSLPLLLNGMWLSRVKPWSLQILINGVQVLHDYTWNLQCPFHGVWPVPEDTWHLSLLQWVIIGSMLLSLCLRNFKVHESMYHPLHHVLKTLDEPPPSPSPPLWRPRWDLPQPDLKTFMD